MADTTYIVLRSVNDDPDESDWTEFARVNAHSAVSAIRVSLQGRSDANGSYVAIPARSFKPVLVKAEQTTILKLT